MNHPKTLRSALALAFAMQASVAHAAEVVIDFETASTTSSYEMISSGYAGLSWGSNVWVISSGALPGTGYVYGTVDSYSSFNGNSLPWQVVFPDTVDFDGAYITNAWTASSSVQVDGYLAGTLVHSTTINPTNTSATWFSFSFDGIDELIMTPSDSSSGHFAVDELTYWTDNDGDGFISTDCDDTSASIYPGADEYCDGVDNNCDGNIDEGTAIDASTWYADTDSDGYGDATVSDVQCTQPSGYVVDGSDCDDTSASNYPGADEYCDGVDNNCDSDIDEDTAVDASTWFADADSDGYGNAAVSDVQCDQPSGYVVDGSDCDDTDATIYLGAEEIPYDGIDQDCDGTDLCDADLDGFDALECAGSDCDDDDETVNTDATEVWYDGIDQDCDEQSDYDSDQDGYDSESYDGEDCDDADPDTYPDAPDENYDGVINDCNEADEYDADGDGYDASDYGGDDCDDANSSVYPGAEELWYDGVDQDCDGNDDDQDGDGYVQEDDCDDLDADSYPGAPGLDDNCDAVEDDGDDGSGAVGDTGDSEALDGGSTGGDKGGCGQGAAAFGLFGLLGLALGRRRRRE